jgi:hypothetical protein
MSSEVGRQIVDDFLTESMSCVTALVRGLNSFRGDAERRIRFFSVANNQMKDVLLGGEHFFLRSSIEYSNPQLTVEEVQGIIAARLLEVCGNYFVSQGLREVNRRDVDEICEGLSKPPLGRIVAFLLNTDDVEPDRYSMNPLKNSILESGQSAFPSAAVTTGMLEIDQRFLEKYEGTLISREEADRIDRHLETSGDSYMDMVDAVKYEHLEELSEVFGIDLCLPVMRMPLTALSQESPKDALHALIRESHEDYEAIERVYMCMGRSMKKKTTLLTVPHSEKGYASKRAARGRISFENTKLKSVKVTYRMTPLYPNAIDPKDISVAQAEDQFTVEGERLRNYEYSTCPSSPQFILYSLHSPEDAVIWHGIGAFGASQLVKSYTTMRVAIVKKSIFKDLQENHRLTPKIPLQFNLLPKNMWAHPLHDNIDASIGCVDNLQDLAAMGMRMTLLPAHKYVRE